MSKDYSKFKYIQDAEVSKIIDDLQKVPMTPAEEFQVEFYEQFFIEGEVSWPNDRLTKIVSKILC